MEPKGVDGTNEAIVKAYNFKWDMVLNVTVPGIGVHAAPVAVNLISYSVMGSIGEVKGYMKYVHNRPYKLDLTHEQFIRKSNLRNRNLAIFSLMAAPLFIILLRMNTFPTDPGLRNMLDVNLSGVPGVEVDLNNNTNGFYLFIPQGQPTSQ